MSDAPLYLPWIDASGDYPAWLKEYWALMAKREADRVARGEPIGRIASSFPLPKLSFLVTCLRALRDQPDLMCKIQDMARKYPDPQDIPDTEISDLAVLIGMFLRWLELKAGEDNLSMARTSLFRIQHSIELGTTYHSDADAIRKEVLGAFFIDDVNKSVGEE